MTTDERDARETIGTGAVPATDIADLDWEPWRTCPARRGEPRATVVRTVATASSAAAVMGLGCAALEHFAGPAGCAPHSLLLGAASALPASLGCAAACASFLNPHWPSVMRRLPKGHGVALTFDDGPHPTLTHRILDALAQRGATATFFVLGEEAARHPGILRRAAGEGHTVGIHGWDHRPVTWLNAREMRRAFLRARDVVEQATGRAVGWYRPPYGLRGPALPATLRLFGWVNVGWRIAGRDWRASAPGAVTQRLDRCVRTRDIVLLHDGGPGASITAQALPDILDALLGRGLSPIGLDETVAV